MLNIFNKKGKLHRYIYFIEGPWNTMKQEQKLPIYFIERCDMFENIFISDYDPWASQDEIDLINDGMLVYV